MKTTYWLLAAAAVAAAGVTVYTRLSAGDPPLPKVPQVADAGRPEVPQLPLPPVVLPPDEPLVPPVPDTAAALPDVPPIALASGTEPLVAPVPVPVTLPATPIIPAVPALPAPLTSDPPFEPLVPPAPKLAVPPAPVTPEPPFVPLVPPAKPALPAAAPLPPAPPTPAPLPLPTPTPVLQPPVPAKPNPLPPVGNVTPPSLPADTGKYAVLKDDKLIEGTVSVSGDTVIVRQGALDRRFPKSQVQYVAASQDEVYKFMLAKVSADDAAARLKVARWCMFSGLREQALTEAREVQKLQPNSTAAADLARSLELSLQQFPPEGAAKMTAPAAPTYTIELRPAPLPVPVPPVAVEPEPDVSPEAALVFGARVQPFLANQCAECHAKPDAGRFKLVRVNPADAGPQATRANLRAVAGQLRKDDPAASPLLLKSLTAHGTMKLPAVESRQAVAYQSLEAWAALAVGTPLAVPPAQPVPQLPLMPPVAAPVVPLPVPTADPLPTPLPLPKPVVPAIPQADPLVPVIPPAVLAPLLPTPVVPVSGAQFGQTMPPKLPVTGPTGGDEFDPAGFNKPPK